MGLWSSSCSERERLPKIGELFISPHLLITTRAARREKGFLAHRGKRDLPDLGLCQRKYRGGKKRKGGGGRTEEAKGSGEGSGFGSDRLVLADGDNCEICS